MDKLQRKIAEIIDRKIDGYWEPLDVAATIIRELKMKQKFDGNNIVCHRYETGWIDD